MKQIERRKSISLNLISRRVGTCLMAYFEKPLWKNSCDYIFDTEVSMILIEIEKIKIVKILRGAKYLPFVAYIL